jgi:hypothetical protein
LGGLGSQPCLTIGDERCVGVIAVEAIGLGAAAFAVEVVVFTILIHAVVSDLDQVRRASGVEVVTLFARGESVEVRGRKPEAPIAIVSDRVGAVLCNGVEENRAVCVVAVGVVLHGIRWWGAVGDGSERVAEAVCVCTCIGDERVGWVIFIDAAVAVVVDTTGDLRGTRKGDTLCIVAVQRCRNAVQIVVGVGFHNLDIVECGTAAHEGQSEQDMVCTRTAECVGNYAVAST